MKSYAINHRITEEPFIIIDAHIVLWTKEQRDDSTIALLHLDISVLIDRS